MKAVWGRSGQGRLWAERLGAPRGVHRSWSQTVSSGPLPAGCVTSGKLQTVSVLWCLVSRA